MRIILDECLPRRFGRELPGHDVSTVQREGWSGVKNGQLLRLIDGRFDVFITVDSNMPAQQNLAGLSFGVVILSAPSNKIEDLRPLSARAASAVETIRPGEVAQVS